MVMINLLSVLCLFPFSRDGKFNVSLAVVSFVFLTVKLCALMYISHTYIIESVKHPSHAPSVLALLCLQTGSAFAENILGAVALIWNRRKLHSLAKSLPPRGFLTYKYHAIPLLLMSVLRFSLFIRNLYNAKNFYMVALATYKLAMGYMQYEALARALNHASFLTSATKYAASLKRNCLLNMNTICRTADTTEELSSLFGIQVIFYTMDAIWRMTNAGIGFLNAIGVLRDFPLSDFSFKLITTETVTFTLYGMLLLISGCQNYQDAVDAFYKELFRLMRESKTLCSNKKLCLYVSMRKTVNFTACGFFNLGYPLITSIIAAATTYLVILVQFSIPKT